MSPLIALLMAATAGAIAVDPGRAPLLLIVSLSTAIVPWARAWRGAGGTALKPALVWAGLALGLSAAAQLAAAAEPLSAGRPMAGRLTYLSVLTVLAALVSVLNARAPGERVWAGLMVLLVVVFMIPWLEEAGRMRRPRGATLVHLDSPWTLFYGLLVVVGVTNYLPTRYGAAAACLGLAFLLEYLGLTRTDWPPERRAVLWQWVAWTLALCPWITRRDAKRASPESKCDGLWFWFRDHWGVVWSLRTLERFNRTAELAGWPVRLTWFGLAPADTGHDQQPLAVVDEAEATLRGLIRRFAEPWRINCVTESCGGKPCDHPPVKRR